jgi:polysaccharide export outer membrane protein
MKLENSGVPSAMKVFRYSLFALLVGFIGASLPIMRAQTAPPGAQTVDAQPPAATKIGPGDLIDLSVYDVPELILKVRVDANGIVSLPLIGDMKLEGMTVSEAQKAITDELVRKELVLQPAVSVFIEEYATKGITLYGEVGAPGIYQLFGPHRLYDAISAAGGLTAKSGQIVTILQGGQTDHEQVIDLSSNVPLDQKNVPVNPGDTIVVSKAGVVYVLGEVNKPGAFMMENNTSISLMKAIALAGSTTKTSSWKHVVIVRKSTEGTLQMEVSLDKIYHAKAGDIPLKPEDIIYVPSSNLKVYGPMGIQAAIQAAIFTVYAYELK